MDKRLKKYISDPNLLNNAADLRDFISIYCANSGGDREYNRNHALRFAETFRWIPTANKSGARALELGSLPLFQESLRAIFKYDEVHGSVFEGSGAESKSYFRQFSMLDDREWYMTHACNLEQEPIPLADSYLDFVLCAEVLEHMEVDPMYMMSEINRTLCLGGALLITTPNSTSSRIVWAVLNGFRPHFFMQYPKDRSLYKHNFEYDPSMLRRIVEDAGFRVLRHETRDTFDRPWNEGLDALKALGMPTSMRGDNQFILAQKISDIKNRYPEGIYY